LEKLQPAFIAMMSRLEARSAEKWCSWVCTKQANFDRNLPCYDLQAGRKMRNRLNLNLSKDTLPEQIGKHNDIWRYAAFGWRNYTVMAEKLVSGLEIGRGDSNVGTGTRVKPLVPIYMKVGKVWKNCPVKKLKKSWVQLPRIKMKKKNIHQPWSEWAFGPEVGAAVSGAESVYRLCQ